MLFHRCDYLEIIKLLDSKIPRFLEKYPGYKIILYKLHYFNMIIQEKTFDEIYNYFNKELQPLLNKYNGILKPDYLVFRYFLENPNTIKSSFYHQILEKVFRIFELGLNISLDWILSIEKEKNKNSSKALNFYKEKENFVKNIDTLINFEKEIVNNSNGTLINKSNFFENKLNNNFDIFNVDNEHDFEDKQSFDNIISSPFDLDHCNDFLCFKNKSLNDDVNNVIFENKNYFINNSFYIDKINNFKNHNFNNKNNINFDINKRINSNSNLNINESLYININTKENKSYKNNSNDSLKNSQYDLKKKNIKKFKFHLLKRENIDKKILRKFKKFLKRKSKEKIQNEIKNYIINSKFWPDYIKMNLMPPFYYDKEKIKFKSFNTKYLCWLFEHACSQELFNIFIKNNEYDLLKLIENAYNISKNSDDYILLKNYINSMPLIYGEKNENRADICTSNKDQYEEVKILNKKEKEEYKDKNFYDFNESFDNMVIDNDYIYSNSKEINNLNIINVNNNIIKNEYINILNKDCKVEKINIFSNPQTFSNEDNNNEILNNNLNEIFFNIRSLNDSFAFKNNI